MYTDFLRSFTREERLRSDPSDMKTRKNSQLSSTFCLVDGGVKNDSIFQFVHANTKTRGPVDVTVKCPPRHPSHPMPFYQVLCIAAHNPEYVRDEPFCIHTFAFSSWPPQRQIKGLVRLAATHILSNGGVVRGIQFWGTETLPQRMRSHGTNRDHGECVLSYLFYHFRDLF